MRTAFFWGLLALGACVGDSTVVVDAGSDATTDVTTDSKPPSDAGGDAIADASGGDADAATFDIKSLQGLQLWLNAGAGVTKDSSNNVSIWADQSGWGNDAKTGGTEPTLPTLVNATNNLPAIHFTNGGHLTIADSNTLHPGTADFSLTIVMRHTTQTTSGNYGLVFAKQATTSGYPGIAVFVDLPNLTPAFFGQVTANEWTSTSETNLNNDLPHVFGFHRIGTLLATRLDGVDDQAVTVDAGTIDCSAIGQPINIGANAVGTQMLTGDVSEIVLLVGPTKAADLAALEAYLKAKYKI